MRKLPIIIGLLSFAWILFSCDNSDDLETTRPGKGGVHYGGILKIQTPERIAGLFPHSGTDKFTRDVTYQIFESLLKYDNTLKRAVPHLAKDFKVSSDGLVYILNLRKDVYFQPNDCFSSENRKMTAKDVKFSLDFACSGLALNKSSFLLINRIQGAKEFHAKSKSIFPKKGVSGIRITGDYQITIELVEPFSSFDKVLTHSNLSIIAREAYETYGAAILNNPVGTGPFMLEEFSEDNVRLKRFDRYWKKDQYGNRLPYLNGFEMTYYTSKRKELEDFQNQRTDLVLNIPAEEIKYLLGTLQDAQSGKNVMHKVYSASSMSVLYLAFANESEEFKDLRVRKAFNQAINKIDLINNWLGGEGWPSVHGFVPPIDAYPNYKVRSLPFDTIAAKKLLAEAGYPNGRNFPKIDIYVNAQKNSPMHKVMIGVSKQLKKHLGVQLGIKLCSLAERDKAILEGKAKIWRAGWIADYPNPENFLSLFYSRNIMANNNTINSFRYKNEEFDNLFETANKVQDEKMRNQLFVQCDQKIVEDAVVLPILTGDFIVLINKKVKNYSPNPMELLDISTIFIRNPR